MNTKYGQAEYTSVTTQNMKLRTPEIRMIDSRIFEPNFDGTRTIIGVPRDFLFPRVLPPVTPQKPIGNTTIKK